MSAFVYTKYLSLLAILCKRFSITLMLQSIFLITLILILIKGLKIEKQHPKEGNCGL